MLQPKSVIRQNDIFSEENKIEVKLSASRDTYTLLSPEINVLQTTNAEEILRFFKKNLENVIYKNSTGNLKNLGYHYSNLERINPFESHPNDYSNYLFNKEDDLPISEQERILIVQALALQGHLINLAYNLARLNLKYISKDKFKVVLPNSMEWQIKEFRKNKVPLSQIKEWINQKVEIVFLWHPTETNSAEFITCLNEFSEFCYSLQEVNITNSNRSLLEAKMNLLFEKLLFTSMAPTRKYDTADSIDRMLVHFENIYFVLPQIYLSILQTLWDNNYFINKVPIFFQLITWVGGDADGVSAMTSSVAKKVIAEMRERIIKLYLTDIGELIAKYESPIHLFESEVNRLKEIYTKLGSSKYKDAEELFEDLSNIKLANCKQLEDLLLKVNTFKFCFAKLEFRQNSQVHLNVVNKIIPKAWIKERISIDSEFRELDEKSKEKVLSDLIDNEQESSRLLDRAILSTKFDQEFKDLIERIELVKQYPDVIENYAIAETNYLSDILAIMFLFTTCKFRSGANFVPLFEKTETIISAPEIIQNLLALKSYKRHLEYRAQISNDRRFQELIIGYSDSGRRSGTIPNRKLLVDVQKEIKRICIAEGIQLRVHHANGDDINRGGGDVIEIIGHCPTPGHKKMAVQGKGWRIRYSHNKDIIEEVLMFYARNLKEFFESDFNTTNKVASEDKSLEFMHSSNNQQIIDRYKKYFFENPTLVSLVNKVFALKILKIANYTVRGISRDNNSRVSLDLDKELTQNDWRIDNIDNLRAIPWNHSAQAIGFNSSAVGLGSLQRMAKLVSQKSELTEFRGKRISEILNSMYISSPLYKEQMKTAAYLLSVQTTRFLWSNLGLDPLDNEGKQMLAEEFEMNKTKKLINMVAWLDIEVEKAKRYVGYSIYGSAASSGSLLKDWPQLNSEVENRNSIGFKLYSIFTYLNRNVANINNNIELTRIAKAGVDEIRLPAYSLRYPYMEIIKG